MATSVQEAKQFYEGTDVNALAVAIGNAHGVYKSTPSYRIFSLNLHGYYFYAGFIA